VSRGIPSVGVNENYPTALFAKKTSNEVVVETTDIIGTLNMVDSNSISSLEVFCIETQSEDLETTEIKTELQKKIPKIDSKLDFKLDVDLSKFESGDAKKISDVLIRYAEIFNS
jgi:hypothetical protein